METNFDNYFNTTQDKEIEYYGFSLESIGLENILDDTNEVIEEYPLDYYTFESFNAMYEAEQIFYSIESMSDFVDDTARFGVKKGMDYSKKHGMNEKSAKVVAKAIMDEVGIMFKEFLKNILNFFKRIFQSLQNLIKQFVIWIKSKSIKSQNALYEKSKNYDIENLMLNISLDKVIKRRLVKPEGFEEIRNIMVHRGETIDKIVPEFEKIADGVLTGREETLLKNTFNRNNKVARASTLALKLKDIKYVSDNPSYFKSVSSILYGSDEKLVKRELTVEEVLKNRELIMSNELIDYGRDISKSSKYFSKSVARLIKIVKDIEKRAVAESKNKGEADKFHDRFKNHLIGPLQDIQRDCISYNREVLNYYQSLYEERNGICRALKIVMRS